MKKKTNDYKMLSSQKHIKITFFSNVNHLNTSIQLTLLNQILQNFVQNAIKFTPDEKSIIIRLRKTKERIIITVTDEGIGIPENVDLFAPFKRVGNQSGVGLGLFLAKNASDALRGKITLINREDVEKAHKVGISQDVINMFEKRKSELQIEKEKVDAKKSLSDEKRRKAGEEVKKSAIEYNEARKNKNDFDKDILNDKKEAANSVLDAFKSSPELINREIVDA
jgi:signal transduction histidine kinase